MGPVAAGEGMLLRAPTDKVEFLICDGLCVSCRHWPECTYPGNREKNVSNCGEYMPSEPEKNEMTEKKLMSMVDSVIRKKNAEILESGQQTGLCRYCLRRDDCTYPRKEGGIWNCDEYEE